MIPPASAGAHLVLAHAFDGGQLVFYHHVEQCPNSFHHPAHRTRSVHDACSSSQHTHTYSGERVSERDVRTPRAHQATITLNVKDMC